LEQIAANVNSLEPLQNLLGTDNVSKFNDELPNAKDDSTRKELLRNIFGSLMTQDAEKVKTELQNLVKHLQNKQQKSEIDELLLRLNKSYPGDVGCFAIYFLNFVKLHEGEALFLGPNEPHAYLYGDCVECMACSDNVVRAGLTPKFMHVDVLCDMLTYNDQALHTMSLGKGVEKQPGIRRFAGQAKEFMVDRVELNKNQVTWKIPSISILIVVQGSATINSIPVKQGDVFLIPSDLEWTANSGDNCLFFVAAANLN
jgi:mannose-6-phosphate isomerase